MTSVRCPECSSLTRVEDPRRIWAAHARNEDCLNLARCCGHLIRVGVRDGEITAGCVTYADLHEAVPAAEARKEVWELQEREHHDAGRWG